jgi:hypothetical protein
MGDRTSKGKSRTQARHDAARRAQQALELRAARVSWDVIADRCGYGSKGAAYSAVQRALKNLPREAAKQLREIELESLDSLERGLTAAALRGHLGAVDRVLRIKDSRAKLTGLYEAPADTGVDEVREALATFLHSAKVNGR